MLSPSTCLPGSGLPAALCTWSSRGPQPVLHLLVKPVGSPHWLVDQLEAMSILAEPSLLPHLSTTPVTLPLGEHSAH